MNRPSSLDVAACLAQAKIEAPHLRARVLSDLFRAFESGVLAARTESDE